MHARERMIQERFATQTCSECGWLYSPRGVLVLARRRSAWMVLVTCGQCGRRGIFVVSFPTHREPSAADSERSDVAGTLGTPGAVRRAASALPADASQESLPINQDEVDQMHAFLAHFDGDFRRLFALPPTPPPNS